MGNGSVPDQIEVSPAKRSRREMEEGGDGAYHSSHNTRVRVSRACEECRRRKDRCDGQRPSCRPCIAAKRDCNYNPSKKRGLRSGYVRSLEMLLGFLFGTIDGSETWVSELLDGNATRPTLQLRALTESIQDAAEFCMHTWRGSAVLKKLENLASLTELGEEDDETHDTLEGKLAQALASISVMGDASDNNEPGFESPSHLPLSPLNTDVASLSNIQERASHQVPRPQQIVEAPNNAATSSSTRCDELGAASQSIPEVLCGGSFTELPANWPYLLDLYFANTHCWFPVSHKHDLLRTAYTLANNNNATNSPKTGDRAFLWAVLAYSNHQLNALDAIQGRTSQKKAATEHLLATAKHLLLVEEGAHEVGHVRALLVLALLETVRSHWELAWVTVGRAVYIVTCLKVLPSPRSQKQVFLEEGVKRTILGCLALEALTASRLDIRPYFHHLDIRKLGPLQEEGIEEWEPWQPKVAQSPQSFSCNATFRQSPGHVFSIFTQFVEVMGLLNKFLSRPESGQNCLHEIAQSLENLRVKLPLLTQEPSDANLSPQLLNLHLAFNCVEKLVQSENNGRINQPTNGNWNRIRQLHNALNERVQGIEAFWIPPSFLPYSFLFRQLLDEDDKLTCDILSKGEKNALGESISSVESLWRTKNNATEASVCLGTTNESSSIQRQQPAHQLQEDAYADVDIPLSSLVTASSETQLHVQPGVLAHSDTIHVVTNAPSEPPLPESRSIAPLQPQDVADGRILTPTYPINSGGFKSPGISLTTQRRNSNEAAREETQRPPKISRNLDFAPLPDSLIGLDTMDENSLFDSLATLDPDDWVANPPEFMRHLGDLRDAPTDLQSFFDNDLQ